MLQNSEKRGNFATMEIKINMKRAIRAITLLIAICIAQNIMAQDRRSVCFEGIPEGTYALSVCDTVALTDSTTILDVLKPYSPMEIDSIRQASPKLYFGYETEQVISGRVKGTFGKVKKPQLHIFVPQTGYRDTYDLDGKQRFHLRGMDFVDGTEYILQATRPSGSDGLIQLEVDDVLFPIVSMKRFQKDVPDSCFIASEGMQEYAQKMEKSEMTIELQEVLVKGDKRIKSQRFGITAGYGYGMNDPMLKKGYTMEYLIMKLGFLMKQSAGVKVPYQRRFVNEGWNSRVEDVVPSIFVDDFPLEISEIDELWNLQSEFIKQIEYYPPEESFNNLLLRGNEAGAIYIYTNTHPNFGKPLSMAEVHQIGYQPERSFVELSPLLVEGAGGGHGATVLWNPSVKVGEDGKAEISFDAVEGKRYKVVLEGVSDKGITVRKEATL